jgi:oxygen-dependent protoporphyrinogen oxidase
VALCRELALEDELVSPGSRVAYVWARAGLRRLPDGLALGVPTRLGPLARSGIVSPLGVGRAAVDLLRWSPRPDTTARAMSDRTVAEITRRHLGHEVTARLVDPLVGGIHAGDTTQMSAAAVFPALLDAARRGGSLMRALRPAAPPPTGTGPGPGTAREDETPVFHTVRGGLSRLVEALSQALVSRGVDIRLRTPVHRLERRAPDGADASSPHDGARWALHGAAGTIDADAVVIAVPAAPAAALLDPVDHALATMVGSIAYADVTLVTLQMPEDAVGRSLDGTGFLVPAEAGRLVTACTWLSSKWPQLHRPGDILLRASMGRFGDDRPARMSDDELVGRVLDDLGPMLGLRSGPTEAVVTRWPGAFPQYALGHTERVSSIEDAVARLPAVALAGAAYRGVGIPACIASGRTAARAVLGERVATGLTTR